MSDGSSPVKDVVTVEQVEALLAKLPGVSSVRIVVNDWGGIEEIHVLASTERSPKQVVRDVESSLAARWGIAVDHKKISVAQLLGTEPNVSPVRLRVANIDLVADAVRGTVRVRVTLSRGDEDDHPLEGVAEGLNTRTATLRLAAEATISALGCVLAPHCAASVDDVRLVTMSGAEVGVVTLGLVTSRGKVELTAGAAVVKGEAVEAMVRAALDAINRRLEKINPLCYRRRAEGEGEGGGRQEEQGIPEGVSPEA